MSGRTGFSKLKIELGFSAPPKKKKTVRNISGEFGHATLVPIKHR
jgi:hypothetical protein